MLSSSMKLLVGKYKYKIYKCTKYDNIGSVILIKQCIFVSVQLMLEKLMVDL